MKINHMSYISFPSLFTIYNLCRRDHYYRNQAIIDIFIILELFHKRAQLIRLSLFYISDNFPFYSLWSTNDLLRLYARIYASEYNV